MIKKEPFQCQIPSTKDKETSRTGKKEQEQERREKERMKERERERERENEHRYAGVARRINQRQARWGFSPRARKSTDVPSMPPPG